MFQNQEIVCTMEIRLIVNVHKRNQSDKPVHAAAPETSEKTVKFFIALVLHD